ncbi:hypothetical protein MTsPCn5_28580 [Croceitalea sp. MTPC5]|uniref:hypothetical protein n=1 Tax=Croceitalea sp. MTPC5 TaxID=3056565 RepID=UPI002B3A9327|nr:hypothetical protein MTsPCn5_28580 [Croceitalea sp. MTPC5]
MQKITFLIFWLCLCSLHAQFGKNCEVRQWKINAISPGLEYEQGIGVNTTFNVRLALQPALDPAVAEPLQDIAIFPALTLQTRFYHNLGQRFRNGRKAFGNAGNYIAPTVAIFGPEERFADDRLVDGLQGYGGLVYGIQRTIGDGFSISIDAGAGYYVGPFEGGIYPVANISIGWIVSEKRWCVGK